MGIGMRDRYRKRGIVRNAANAITALRIACSAALLFVPVFSAAFYVLYLVAGAGDMLDGAVARRTGTVTRFGSRLDTAADFAMTAVCMNRLIPVIEAPVWLLIWAAAIAAVRAVNLISGYVMKRQFIVLHTAMNKAAGALLFLLPLTLRAVDLDRSGAVVCTVAAFAALQEGHLIRTGTIDI